MDKRPKGAAKHEHFIDLLELVLARQLAAYDPIKDRQQVCRPCQNSAFRSGCCKLGNVRKNREEQGETAETPPAHSRLFISYRESHEKQLVGTTTRSLSNHGLYLVATVVKVIHYSPLHIRAQESRPPFSLLRQVAQFWSRFCVPFPASFERICMESRPGVRDIPRYPTPPLHRLESVHVSCTFQLKRHPTPRAGSPALGI